MGSHPIHGEMIGITLLHIAATAFVVRGAHNDRSSNAAKFQGLDLEVTPEVLKFALHKQQVNRRTLTPQLLAAAERRLNGFTMYPLFVGDEVTFTKAHRYGMYVEGGQGQLIARKPLRPLSGLTHLPQQHKT